MTAINLGFIESEMRSVGSLASSEIGLAPNPTTQAIFNAAGQQQTIPVNSVWVVVMFQGHLLSGGSGDSASAQLIDLVSGVVYATLVLTQAGSFAIENQGREFGPLIAPSDGSLTLTCQVINGTDGDEVAVLANIEQVYGDPAA